MSKRLASFAGPSTPSSSPILAQSTDTTPTKPKSGTKNKNRSRDVTPSSPSPLSPNREPKSPPSQRILKAGVSSSSLGSKTSVHAPAAPKTQSTTASESPLQLHTRIALKHTAADLEDWGALVSRRAFACARTIVDRTTELDNALSILPEGAQPRSRMLGPRLRELNSKREELRGYLVDLDVSFTRIAERVTGLEVALAKLTQRDGQESTENSPVWSETSWSFSLHVSHIVRLLRQLNRTRYTLTTLAEQVVAYSLSSGCSSQPANPHPAPSGSETRPTYSSPQSVSLVTFAQARMALASWSSEASRTAESTKEWLEACTIEVPAWDEIDIGREYGDGELGLETL